MCRAIPVQFNYLKKNFLILIHCDTGHLRVGSGGASGDVNSSKTIDFFCQNDSLVLLKASTLECYNGMFYTLDPNQRQFVPNKFYPGVDVCVPPPIPCPMTDFPTPLQSHLKTSDILHKNSRHV